jgi:ribosomal protein S18 acetylase RimI-like enzyme
MQVNIRRAVPGDNVRIRTLQEEIARLHFEGRSDLFREEARYYGDEAFFEKLNNPDFYVYIAVSEDEEVIGYAFANIIRYRGHPTYRDFDSFYIDDICVLEKCRQQGIGRQLFDRCREQAQMLQCHNIDLGVYSFNKNAIAFYEAMGMRARMTRMEIRLE